MFSDTFDRGYRSKLCQQLSSADANDGTLVQSYSRVAAQRWMLAGAWRRRTLAGLGAASRAPEHAAQMGAPWLRLCSQAQPLTRESDREFWGLVVSWTVPGGVAAEPAAHRLVSPLLQGRAACGRACCAWLAPLGGGGHSWGSGPWGSRVVSCSRSSLMRYVLVCLNDTCCCSAVG